ncbi:MAG: flagellar hook-basal body complex protein [Lachnospiraceae bacterium]|nr:flagellar hook-basal body complex protein [Lachnospiraceae bacterium]
MMRSLFSGVAGLRTHQTRMDVIGNNIANVNTTSYKSQSMVFSDLLYQTTQAASGANATTGRGGINARQIGLGAKTAAISTSITSQGSAQSTNNPFDIMITGESFFIVNNGSQNFFTRDGSFTIDGAGNLVMSSTGYTVMGWQVDPETGDVLPDTVSALRVMNERNLTYPPEFTTKAIATGIVDKHDTATRSTAGRAITLTIYDNLGYQYTAKFSIHNLDGDGEYYVQLDDILDSDAVSLVKSYNLSSIREIASFGQEDTITATTLYQLLETAEYDYENNSYSMKYQPANILDGYSSNQLINAATTTSITNLGTTAVNKGTNEYDINEGDMVTVKGTIKLSKSELQAPNFNLIYAVDTEHSNTSVTNYCYYGKDKDGNSVTLNQDGDAGKADWQKVLEKSFPDVTVENIKVNADGSIEMDFSQNFQALKTATYHLDKDYFIGEQIEDPLEAYGLSNTENTKYSFETVAPDGQAQITKSFTYTGNKLVFNTDDGTFSYIGSTDNDTAVLDFNIQATSRRGETISLTHFSDVDIDFSQIMNLNNGGKTTASLTGGDAENGEGAGRKVGEMTGIEVGQDGTITAYYDNNQSKVLGQIAVANFANAAGLSKVGNNLYSTTMNSGDFDGIGSDITEGDGKMESGVLEMSNVDLSSEFTEMITTQRGFQANSRIITVSDNMLEELVNLKR